MPVERRSAASGHGPFGGGPRAADRASTLISLVDQTWVDVSPAVLAAVVGHPANHTLWWPHLSLELELDRGRLGRLWRIDGQIVGSMEIWLEPFWDGAVVHHFVRGVRGPGAPRNVGIRHTLRWKRCVLALKDRLEQGGL